MDSETTHHPKPARGLNFWMSFVSLCTALALFALELTSVSTALPTIVDDLHTSEFAWIGASYALSSTAFLPLSGRLAQIFGRKPTLISAVLIFAIGSALCGAAVSQSMMLIGRTVQGVGGGAIVALGDILLGDLVPLRDRGLFFGLLGLTWSIAAASGPVIGGSLASAGAWRWIFYLNLPLCGVSILLSAVFLHLRSPNIPIREGITRMDWSGNFLVVAGSTLFAIAITWGGVRYAWDTAHVLVPLCLGIVSLVAFFLYEGYMATEPIVPFLLMSNRTSASGYLQDFISPVVVLAAVYFIPIYYQGCKDSSPLTSGVQMLGFASISPASIVAGVTVVATQKYRPSLWFGWCLTIVGTVLISTVHADTPSAVMIGYTIVTGVGAGFVYALAQFPVQAPLPVTENARSLAFFAFLRAFSSIWGITIGNTILQNALTSRLPAEFLAQFPDGVSLAYTIIPEIPQLAQPLKDQVRVAFADSLQLLWKIMAGLAGAGLFVSLFMQEVPMHAITDEDWAAEEATKEQT
ncbi:related to fusarin C cluster-transporter [Armillaria ostoyae]|uniref:Related to fusarin C cluster-transporter n=2 Tax=Armillaria TaxID=47424 RepID=A0A284RWZ2_ARMOS|nr:MFS general substrate transporter [Armillaria solidipes]SJL13271.1 related to fusarin C cluster-transporter [Armillaria ostoyae]